MGQRTSQCNARSGLHLTGASGPRRRHVSSRRHRILALPSQPEAQSHNMFVELARHRSCATQHNPRQTATVPSCCEEHHDPAGLPNAASAQGESSELKLAKASNCPRMQSRLHEWQHAKCHVRDAAQQSCGHPNLREPHGSSAARQRARQASHKQTCNRQHATCNAAAQSAQHNTATCTGKCTTCKAHNMQGTQHATCRP